MYKTLALPVVFLLSMLLSMGQSKGASPYAGSYNLVTGYTTGSWAGLFGIGTATAARNGRVAYSAYFPYNGLIGYGSGVINRNGVFILNNGASGSAKIHSRAGYGYFTDGLGSGVFAVGR